MQSRLHRTLQIEPSWVSDGVARRVPGPSKNSRSGAGGVEPALYTVEGRQTGDLRQKCGSVLIRKAKLPARIVWKAVPFGRDGLQTAFERVRATRRWSCVAFWSSMTIGTLP